MTFATDRRRHVLLLFNAPALPADHPDYAQEAAVFEQVEAAEAALPTDEFVVERLGLRGDAGPLLARLQQPQRPDVVLNFCESLGGQSGAEMHVAALLELLDFPFSGSDAASIGLAHDKVRTKQLLRGAGIPTADFVAIPKALTGHEAAQPLEPPDEARAAELQRAFADLLAQGPVIVKPAAEDASLGIDQANVVSTLPALQHAIARLGWQFGDVLVERYIDGREFNLGILDLGQTQVLPVAEIEFTTTPEFPWAIVTYDAKWASGSVADRATRPRCPANLEEPLAQQLRELALRAYSVVGCRDYCRVDLRVDRQGRPFVLEVNANPDLSPSAGLARALRAAGLDYNTVLLEMTRRAMRRGKGRLATALANHPRHAPTTPARQDRHGLGDLLTVRSMLPDDAPTLEEILRQTGVFRDDEIAVGREVVAAALQPGNPDGYHVLVARRAEQIVGWSCHGQVPMTDATWDLYWIAVDPALQSIGVGRRLLEAVEADVLTHFGRWLIAETSSLTSYETTHEFYRRNGFALLGSIPDFYRVGDGRLTFGKRLS